MSKIKLIIDQASDLPKDILKQYNITVINLNVTFGETTSNTLTNAEFYKMMKESPILPKTSCPSPDAFMTAYQGDEEVLMLTLSNKLSATYSAAVLAKEMFESENPGKKIEIVDSSNGSIGSGLVAIKAARMIESGMSLDEVVAELKVLSDNIIHYGSLETIENAVKGGRLSKTAGFVANALNLKPILQIVDHEVKVVDKVRGSKNSMKKMLDMIDRDMKSTGKTYKTVGIAHANDPSQAEIVKAMVQEKWNFEEVLVAEIGPIIGTYSSSGAVLVSVI